MTEKEVDVVAEELAKAGGISWYPGRSEDPVLRVVTERFRQRARAAIAALDHYRSAAAATLRVGEQIPIAPCATSTGDRLRVGATVIYRPPGDRRAYSCTVDQVGDGQLHLVPQMPGCDGWVREQGLVTEDVVKNLKEQGVIARKHTRRLGSQRRDRHSG